MDFYELVRTRRSIRNYKSNPVPEDVLDRILEAVRVAPSGSNRQPWRWIIVKDEEARRNLAKACNDQMWIADAPLSIVACGTNISYNRGEYMGDMSMLVDVSIAFTHLILAARNEGLGTCWIGAFKNNEIKDLLKIPEGWDVVAVTPLGYPEGGKKAFQEPNNRKSIKKILSTGKF